MLETLAVNGARLLARMDNAPLPLDRVVRAWKLLGLELIAGSKDREAVERLDGELAVTGITCEELLPPMLALVIAELIEDRSPREVRYSEV